MTETLEEKNPVNQIFDLFYTINPGINYANMGSRKAAEWLIKRFGLEQTLELVQFSIQAYGKEFAPTITTPYQLKEKLGVLGAYYQRQQKPAIKKNLIL